MNRPMRKVAIALAVLFVALFVNLNVVQVVQGSHYRNDPQNRRVLLNEYSSPRGQIVVGGVAVAESRATKDELKYLRVYPDGPQFASATGFYSFLYGAGGIEYDENAILSGDSSQLFTSNLANILTGRNPGGGSVELTLNKDAQLAAYNAMRGANGQLRSGAVVALDPSTGAILALVSTPSYDPNQLSSHNSGTISQAWSCYSALDTSVSSGETQAQLNQHIQQQLAQREQTPAQNPNGCRGIPEDPTAFFAANPYADSPMLNRALNQTYPAGSIFKVIDAAAALKYGLKPTDQIAAPDSYWPLDPQRTSACPSGLSAPCVQNFEGETCYNGKTATLAYALAKSCNTAFAALAVDRLGGQQIQSQAQAFGFDDPQQLHIPLPVAGSTIGTASDLSDPAALAQTAFGQRDVRVTPLQAAMLSAAVANNGLLMKPFLVKSELRPNLSVLNATQPQQMTQVISPDLDAELVTMMQGVVTSPEGTGGTANITDIPGVQVGGKTGTADVGVTSASNVAPDAWFTGFATVNGSGKIAVAVIIENGGVAGNESAGGAAAGPVAKKVMEAYLNSPGVMNQ
jgi:peptidoglycan glycosyltransferase